MTSPATDGSPLPALAVTGSHWLRQEIDECARQAGCDIDHAEQISQARKGSHRRPMIIIGGDLLPRVQQPVTCRGLVIAAVLDPAEPQAFHDAGRIRADHFVALPTGAGWLIDQLLRGPVT